MHSRMLAPIFLGIGLIAAAPGMAEVQPAVQAALSQITGQTEPGKAGQTNPPSVEMRFFTGPSEDCSSFTATVGGQPTGVRAAMRSADPGAGWSGVKVCALAMKAGWEQAALETYNDVGNPAAGSTQVVLDSQINLGPNVNIASGEFYSDPGLKNPVDWEPGPSDGQAVILSGPASIGQNTELRMVTLGDTGCRGGGEQDCASTIGGQG